MMQVLEVLSTSRSAAFEIRNGHPYCSPWPHRVRLNGRPAWETTSNAFTLRHLAPDTEYRLEVFSNGDRREIAFRTDPERGRMDIRACGAVGNGRSDDTAAIQAAIQSCPEGGVVEFPPGEWLSGPLFLKSRIGLYFAAGARLIGHPDIDRWPVLPALVPGAHGAGDIVLGSWEGTPANCHAGLLTGIGVQGVRIFGEGCIDGNASFSTWWSRPKQPFRGWRPRTVYLVDASDVVIEGVELRNSPSWTIHCLGSRELRFACLRIEAPPTSPNTDGINPESCENVRIVGARISTGDDCIAIKSGKTWVAGRPPPPTRSVVISNCLMENGHGAVVIGSEMAGGVYDVAVYDCMFRGTDRGLRIKTRRGRGKAAIVAGVHLDNVRMERVGTPFVVNSFYHCDPDGRTPYVGDRRPLPVDDGTPTLRDISVKDVVCEQAAHSAGFVLGLPERPLDRLRIENYRVRFDPHAEPGYPDMADSIEATVRAGLYLCNVRNTTLEDIHIEGAEGPVIIRENAE